MQLAPINKNVSYNNYLSPSFKSTGRCIMRKDKKIICNYTKFFREDLDWEKFVKLLAEKYKYISKVNVFNLACSDGSEPLTLMSSLLNFAPDDANKFFPIKASDIDQHIISMAQSGIYNINDADLRNINLILSHYSDYFMMTRSSKISFPLALSILPKYSNNVSFECLDLVDVIKDLPPKNNIILCRNVLPYLKSPLKEEVVEMLAQKLDSTSLLVIGSYDNGHDIDKLLLSNGFKHYKIENVYFKP